MNRITAALLASIALTFAGHAAHAAGFVVICDASNVSNCLKVNPDGSLSSLDENSAAMLAAMTAAIPPGTNLIGKTGIDQTTQGTTNNVTVGAVATGGATPFHLASSAASNNATLVSTGAHTLLSLVIFTTATSIADVRIYDTAGSPSCSSSTGVVLNFPVQAVSGAVGGVAVPIPAQGMVLANGLGYCITGAVSDSDNTNAPTGVGVGGLYK